MRLLMYTSAFCGPCAVARRVVERAGTLVPSLSVVERDIASWPDEAERDGVRMTPTLIVADDAGTEVFRGEGPPSMPQLLQALSRALPGE
ncbi:thioredoxin [Mycetocola reblochoni]|nr:thioredoxin family protein [Mycetocola reblochoni]RLP69336.1 thioredoxin [Mycetocola reblochoni]